MTGRFPIMVGDRVALAAHLDLWMSGVRYGTVANQRINPKTGRMEWLIQYPTGVDVDLRTFWATSEDLMGAVGPTASEREQ